MLQNRVNPWGNLCAVPERGTLMGNRGILHDANRQITRPWRHKNWVICVLSFANIKRPGIFLQGNYSELFFLDEATAFSAGHRPCSYCQRERSRDFKHRWALANNAASGLTMVALDKQLHLERVAPNGSKKTYPASYASLPIGTFFEHKGIALVKTNHGALPWSFSGYGAAITLAQDQIVTVLTPRSIVNAFAAGFVPSLHLSAGEQSSTNHLGKAGRRTIL